MVEVLDCLRVMEDVDLGIKIPATLTLTIVEFIVVVIKVLTMGYLNICLKIPDYVPLAIM